MKAHVPEEASRRAAFTLIELLVVIGLMAMLGTFSVAGYFSAVRNMSNRAVIQDTISLIRLARQVCLIDQTPTAVLFYNRRTQSEDPESTEEAVATSAGTAVAVKMAGRISYFNNNILIDEFADWNQSCPMGGKDDSSGGIRFYRMSDLEQNVGGGIDKCSSIVSAYVVPVDDYRDAYMIASGQQLHEFCSDYKKTRDINMKFSNSDVANGNDYRWGHRVTKSNGIQWKMGDAYGVEIGSLTLPKGFIYGTQAPGATRIESVPSIDFDPRDLSKFNRYDLSANSVKISAWRKDKFNPIGTIRNNDLDDEQGKD